MKIHISYPTESGEAVTVKKAVDCLKRELGAPSRMKVYTDGDGEHVSLRYDKPLDSSRKI